MCKSVNLPMLFHTQLSLYLKLTKKKSRVLRLFWGVATTFKITKKFAWKYIGKMDISFLHFLLHFFDSKGSLPHRSICLPTLLINVTKYSVVFFIWSLPILYAHTVRNGLGCKLKIRIHLTFAVAVVKRIKTLKSIFSLGKPSINKNYEGRYGRKKFGR